MISEPGHDFGPPVAPRVVAIADSDSYLKWGAATLDAMPADWVCEQWLVSSPIAPSAAQVAAATTRPVSTLSLARMLPRLRASRPDVVLLACTGPVVQTVITMIDLLDRTANRGAQNRPRHRRPVIVTGLPGISIPATERAVEFRRGVDCFVVHSRRERAEFEALAHRLDAPVRFSLAQLPFVAALPTSRSDGQVDDHARDHRDGRPEPTDPTGGTVVFAAQAKVPAEPDHRRAILRALADVPPGLRSVIKVRALAGEQQTHRELWSYAELWDELVADGEYIRDAVSFRGGSMAEALDPAAAFVTVSSTAALEAISRGLPILVLDDFGVSAEMINEVFVGSGCLGSLTGLRTAAFHHPDPDWLSDNYFHPGAECDWGPMISDLLARREAGELPSIGYGVSAVTDRRRRMRHAIRLLLPTPVATGLRRGMRVLRRTTRRVTRRVGGSAGSGVAGGQDTLADLPDGPGSG